MYAAREVSGGGWASAWHGSRDAGVYYLGHGSMALIGHEVEDHSLDVRTAHVPPFQILCGEFGVLG
jgi:hypothetical protein